MSDLVDYFMQKPAIARNVAAAVFVSSVGVYTSLLPSYYFIFHHSLVFKLWIPEIWRCVSSFLLTGPGLAVLFDTYFVFTYLSQLETGKLAKKEELAWYLMVVGAIILFLNSIFTGAVVFLQALLIALCYTANCDLRGQTAHFYIITIPAQMMPYCLLLVQLLFPNGLENLKVGLTGLVAAHMHDFLTRIYPEFGGGPNLAPTPWFMSYIVRTPRIENRAFGQVWNARKEKDDSGSSSGGPLPDAWKSRGSGRRLG